MNEKNNVISRAGAFLGDCVPDLVTVSWREPGAPPVLFSCTTSTQRTSCAQHKVALSEEQQRAHSIRGGSVGESCQQSPQPGPGLPEENGTGAVQAPRAQHANTAALYETRRAQGATARRDPRRPQAPLQRSRVSTEAGCSSRGGGWPHTQACTHMHTALLKAACFLPAHHWPRVLAWLRTSAAVIL